MSTAPAIADTHHSARIGALRRICSFPVMLCGLLAVLSVLTVRDRFNDPDMWWHLKTGEVIWTTHTIPTTDLFSFTTHHHAWTPHEWLAQVLIYGAYRWGGYTGLMLWLCFFTALLLIAGYVLCALYSGNAKTALIGALTIWFFSTTGLAIRPQMIGYLFIIVELLLIQLGRTRSPRWFFWLPPLFAVWVNCHGSFFLGLILMGGFIVCSLFDFQIGLLTASRWEPRRRRTLTLALGLSVAALFVNPIGISQILYPVRVMGTLPLNLSQVDEWKPLQLTDPRGIALLLVLCCVFLLPLLRRSELLWHELFLLALGAELAISHERMVFVFGLLVAPVLSRLISNSWDNYDPAHDLVIPNAVLLVCSIAVVTLGFPKHSNLVRQVDAGNPTGGVEYIKAHHLSGNMLNAYGYGGYLIWALPEHPVFVDGRGDVFEWVGVFGDFAQWATLQSDPNTLLNKYDISFCFLEQTSPMARVLSLLPGWKLAYSDQASVIFVRSSRMPVTALSR